MNLSKIKSLPLLGGGWRGLFATFTLNKWRIVAMLVWWLLLSLAGFFIGYTYNTKTNQQQIIEAKTAAITQASEQASAVYNQVMGDMVAAQNKADTLTKQLLATEQQLNTQAKNHAQQIQKLTTGGTCFNGATVRLLNQNSGLQTPSLPNTTSGVNATGAAIATNTHATDTDVANWADNAINQQAICKHRLDALIDWTTNPIEKE